MDNLKNATEFSLTAL